MVIGRKNQKIMFRFRIETLLSAGRFTGFLLMSLLNDLSWNSAVCPV